MKIPNTRGEFRNQMQRSCWPISAVKASRGFWWISAGCTPVDQPPWKGHSSEPPPSNQMNLCAATMLAPPDLDMRACAVAADAPRAFLACWPPVYRPIPSSIAFRGWACSVMAEKKVDRTTKSSGTRRKTGYEIWTWSKGGVLNMSGREVSERDWKSMTLE